MRPNVAQVCWRCFFATVAEFARRLLNQRLFRWINLACALFMAYMGLAPLLQTGRLILL